jgi:hypothetical protein
VLGETPFDPELNRLRARAGARSRPPAPLSAESIVSNLRQPGSTSLKLSDTEWAMTPDIPGAETIFSRFGKWPSFHDAEIVSVHINRGATSTVSITRVDGRDTAIVTFTFANIIDLKLDGEDADIQNVISSLKVERTAKGIRVAFAPCYGLWGEITAKSVTVAID